MRILTWIVTAGLLFSSSLVLASETLTDVIVDNGFTIGSEARCVQSSGIPIKEVPDNQVKVACLKDKTVQSICNPDGSHAQAEAFRQWVGQLMDFKERCVGVGGSFAFADAKFQEPTNATFCSMSQPEVQYSAFETPMCNFVSRCPRVAVSCIKTEEIMHNSPRIVSLPGIPRPISITPQ